MGVTSWGIFVLTAYFFISPLENENFWKCTLWDAIQGKTMLRSWDIHFIHISNLFISYESCDVMKSIRTRRRIHFWIYLLNRKSFVHETNSQLVDIVMRKMFRRTRFLTPFCRRSISYRNQSIYLLCK